jgi:inner membrane protein
VRNGFVGDSSRAEVSSARYFKATPGLGGMNPSHKEVGLAHSAIGRLAIMSLLALFLMVPMTMVDSMVRERSNRRDEAVSEVGESWGGRQTVSGPVLVVPYTQTWTDEKGRALSASGQAYFLPSELRVDSVVNTQPRSRGIFDVVVYTTTLKVEGTFIRPDLDWLRHVPTDIRWAEATVTVGVSDPKALTRRASLAMPATSGTTTAFTGSLIDIGLFTAGLRASARGLNAAQVGTAIPFAYTLELRGTRELRFLPTAEETTVKVASQWPHASFIGARLPEPRTTGVSGFTAEWHVPDFGRPFPSRWIAEEMNREKLAAQAAAATFGVNLSQPVDIYQQSERAVKYALLFIVLTFLVFFLWELFRVALLHPMQYVFVGFALCVFYLLLLSLSEHVGFDIAYGTSAGVTTLLIAGYAGAVLNGWRQGSSVATSLLTLYGFLYLLLRLEDYALLAGSVGLFLVLAGVMYLTRRMNWYKLRLGGEAAQTRS